VYHDVVTAPSTMSASDVRKVCAQGFRRAYRLARYVVAGEEHLPTTSGHIFIFNHLKNHEYNTLPNNFQLTLDSHFVSAVILDPRYGDGGIRVVRKSRGTEYGHQNYYDRLGHISVYTAESDQLEETAEQRRARRSEFFETAGAHLRAGTNLILSPEGTSYWTEDTPGPFKPGAFRLAASVEPEPRIVPIAVANFDRRVHSTVYAVLIKPPFRISEVITDPQDPEEMRRFLLDYQQTYATYVREARDLARDASNHPIESVAP
jgi:1-acyl-sn-glycerol-3-phosphate acyltransferase